MKKFIIIALAFILAVSLEGCGGSSAPDRNTARMGAAPMAPAPAAAPESEPAYGFAADEAAAYDEEAVDVPETSAETGGGFAGPQTEAFLESRKIIRNASLELQTLRFEQAVASVEALTAAYGGYMESSYVSGRDINSSYGYGTRNANFSARIPADSLDAFLNSFSGYEFNIIGRSTSDTDVTDSYFDSQARLDSLKLQEQRLLGMLDGATELEYMIQLEQELARVRYEIESLTSQLRRMDGYISFSTVNISLYEVVKYEEIDAAPATFGERVSQAFTSSWRAFGDFCQSFAVAFVSALPFLLLLAAIAVVTLLIVKVALRNRKPRERFNAKPPYTPPTEVKESPEDAEK